MIYFVVQYIVCMRDSICGAGISFVGIAVPFLTRKAFGTSKPIVIIPGTFFAGAVFCMSCDLIARMALAPVELNISTVTSIVGAPIVIYMMVKREKGR